MRRNFLFHCVKMNYSSIHCKWRAPILFALHQRTPTSGLATECYHSTNHPKTCRFSSSEHTDQHRLFTTSTSSNSDLLSSRNQCIHNLGHFMPSPNTVNGFFNASTSEFSIFQTQNSSTVNCKFNKKFYLKISERFLSTTSPNLKLESDSSLRWKIDHKHKIIEATSKLKDAKEKLEDAKLNLIEDIQGTKSRMKEKMGEIIEVRAQFCSSIYIL